MTRRIGGDVPARRAAPQFEAHRAAEPTLGITGLRLFTFNHVAVSEAWPRAVHTTMEHPDE